MSDIVFLGPQRRRPEVAGVLDSLGLEGPLAIVTAGWQEREGELDELREHVGREVVDLELYRRAEGLFRADRELFRTHQERQGKLKALQELYRLRLRHALEAVRELRREDSAEPSLLRGELRAAMDAVRTLDRQHLRQVVRIHSEYPQLRLENSDARRELAEVVRASQAVLIAGGHVATLLNRLRLFNLRPLMEDKPLVAWSAGAMALCERVLLFHDCPPQGAGDAEWLETGLGLVQGVVALPSASDRLQLDDPERVGRLARRAGRCLCATLDEGSRLHWRDGRLANASGSLRLTLQGRVKPIETA